MISGNMRKMDGITQLVGTADGRTRVIFHTDSIPGYWIPPIAGNAFIEHETREQFQELRDEIFRRKSPPTEGRETSDHNKLPLAPK
jgi:hypothetical protein